MLKVRPKIQNVLFSFYGYGFYARDMWRAYLPANRQVILRAAKNLVFLPRVNWTAPLKLDKIKWEW